MRFLTRTRGRWHEFVRVCLLVLLVLPVMGCPKPERGFQVVPEQGLTLYQLDLGFPEAEQPDSSYGLAVVNFGQLAEVSGISQGYLNIFSGLKPDGWVVRNLPIDATSGIPGWSTMFDLGSEGDVSELEILAELSAKPVVHFTGVPKTVFPVGALPYDAQGRNAPRRSVPNRLDASVIKFEAEGVIDVVFQPGHPSIEQDDNQCGPAAVANSLQWLEDTYEGVEVPDPHRPGIGDDSLVGKLDDAMNRDPHDTVADQDALNGKISYIDGAGLGDDLDLKHKNRPGESFVPNSDVTVGETTSKADTNAEESLVEWVIGELADGEDVELAIGWDDGGGHWVNLIAGGHVLGVPWVGWVHDADQGFDDEGTPDDTSDDTVDENGGNGAGDGGIGWSPIVDNRIVGFIEGEFAAGTIDLAFSESPSEDGGERTAGEGE